ncbi:MAG TPA: flagellar export chaperone FlgN [Fimbriimonadaceae bacterium]|nr:flagellar export chaperone FlgN [Fimbriimonadaceae bacterium]
MKTRDLQQLWWDWLGTSERLLRSLYEQTAALTLRDVARVERIQPELDQMLAKLRELDAQAVTLAHKLAGELETEPNLRSLASVLEKAEAQALVGLGNRVTVAARNVQDVLKKNRTLIENEMNYINGSLTLVAKAAVQAQGPFNTSKPDSILVDQAA